MRKDESARFRSLLKDVTDERTMRMAAFVQHGSISTLEHCHNVARTSFALACRLEQLGISVEMRELVRAAYLHDYFLYDWHAGGPASAGHAIRHPLTAAANAERDFGLSSRERNIIESHMWPLPPGPSRRIPHCREAWIVNAADKWCSLVETLAHRKPKLSS